MGEGVPLSQTLIMLIPLSAAAIAFYLWCALALSAVFAKSGEPRWPAWVPVLNLFRVLRLGGVSGWWVLLLLVPGLGALVVWILVVIAAHRINVSFGYGAGMTVLAALLFPVWATVLGFGSARWIGTEGPRRRGSSLAAPDPDASSAATAWMTVAPPAPPGPPPVSPFAPPADDEPRSGRAAPAPAAESAASEPDTSGWSILADLAEAPEPPAPEPASPMRVAAAPPPAPGPTVTDVEPAVERADPHPPPAPTAGADFAPPASAVRPAQTGATGLSGSDEPFDEVTGAIPNAPAPVSAVADRSRYEDAPLFPPVNDGEHWGTGAETDAFPEASGPVSAIVGSPVAGSPRMARSAVSASADEGGDFDATLLAHRNRPRWSLVTASGDEFELRSHIVILGRRPAPDPDHSGAQLIALDDATVSKTHARLERRGEQWHVLDLGSTNGVVAISVTGAEVELAPRGEAVVGERILLGDLELRLVRVTR